MTYYELSLLSEEIFLTIPKFFSLQPLNSYSIITYRAILHKKKRKNLFQT